MRKLTKKQRAEINEIDKAASHLMKYLNKRHPSSVSAIVTQDSVKLFKRFVYGVTYKYTKTKKAPTSLKYTFIK